MRRTALALLLAALAAAPAASPSWAQSRPQNLQPTRDVAVTYRMLGVPQGQGVPANAEIGMAYSAAEGRMRMDMSSMLPGAWGLVNLRSGEMNIVMDGMRVVMRNPGGDAMTRAFRMADNARMTREGAGSYAGQSCTNWRWEHEGQRGTACLTDDGVMLRAANEQGQGMEAARVSYDRQDPARFRLPQGYQEMNAQQMMQGLGAPGGQPPRR